MGALTDVPGADQLTDEVVDLLERFLDGLCRLDTRQDAIDVLCRLQSLVSRAGVTRFPDVAADCFCGSRTGEFRNDSESLRFIVEATVDRLRSIGAPS